MASAEARQRADAAASRALAPLAWGLVAAAAGASVALLEPNLLEEGIVVHAAERIAAGEHLFRDILLHTGPFPYEILGLLFRALGAKLEWARAAVLVFQGLGTAALFAALRRAGLGPRAHAAAALWVVSPLLLFPLYSTFFYSTLVSYLALLLVYAGLRALRSTPWAVAAGAVVASIALCKQSTGALLAAAFLPALLSGADRGARRARALGYAAGGGALALATLALFAARGDLGALLFAQIELPLAMGRSAGFQMPFINLWPPGELDAPTFRNWPMYFPSLYNLRYGLWEPFSRATVLGVQLLYLLPFAALVASAARLLPVFGRAHPVVWIHAAVLLAMAANLFPRADWGHLVVALPPAAVQLLLLPAGVRARAPRRAAGVRAAAPAAGLLAVGALVAIWLHSIAGPASFGPRVPLRPVSAGYRTPAVPRVIAYLRERVAPGEAIFVARQEPLLYFATGTRNPTRLPGVLPGLPELQEDAILEALGSVRFVVMSDIDQAIHAYYSRELPRVWRHLERHFEVPADFPLDADSWIAVLRRRPDRGATALDLLEEAPRARAWLRSGQGLRSDVAGSPPQLLPRRLRRPLAVPVGRFGGGLDFHIRVPEGALFQADLGLAGVTSARARYGHPPGATAVVSAARGEVFEELAALPIGEPGQRWRPLEADLSAFAGESVTLRLEMRLEAPLENATFAWWGSPRIALRGG